MMKAIKSNTALRGFRTTLFTPGTVVLSFTPPPQSASKHLPYRENISLVSNTSKTPPRKLRGEPPRPPPIQGEAVESLKFGVSVSTQVSWSRNTLNLVFFYQSATENMLRNLRGSFCTLMKAAQRFFGLQRPHLDTLHEARVIRSESASVNHLHLIQKMKILQKQLLLHHTPPL